MGEFRLKGFRKMGHWRPFRRGEISSAGQGPPVRFEVVNAGSIAERDSAADRGGAGRVFLCRMRGHRHGGGWLLQMCEKCANWGTISRELRQGRELQLLSLELA